MTSIEEEFIEQCKRNSELLQKPKKRDLTLTIREDIIDKLKELEVNISDMVERFLIYYITERDNEKDKEEVKQ